MWCFKIVDFGQHSGGTACFRGLIDVCFIGSELPTEYKFLGQMFTSNLTWQTYCWHFLYADTRTLVGVAVSASQLFVLICEILMTAWRRGEVSDSKQGRMGSAPTRLPPTQWEGGTENHSASPVNPFVFPPMPCLLLARTNHLSSQ